MKQKKQIFLAGNAVTAEILYAYLRDDERYDVIGLTVDDEFLDKGSITGLKSVPLSQVTEIFSPENCKVIMAVGYNDLNRVRESLFNRLKQMGYEIETYVHPAAQVFTSAPIGEGSVILPSAVIEPFAQVGTNTMIWCNVSLAHHCIVSDNCWIAAGTVISGQAKVLRNSFVGVNATVVNDVTVEAYNIVGANALISKSTKSHAVNIARSAELFRYSSEEYVKFFGI
jgi:sugar O-acyltransferase (sialic acid O-acetyltransferase NeuD family)